jgi:predicted nucleic acid-binding protein
MHLVEGEARRTTLNIDDDLLDKGAELTGVSLWTLDKRLHAAAAQLNLAP